MGYTGNTMIAVRIPEEIKKYKERIMFGLTARQLIAVILTCGICVPLYFLGRDKIPEDILSWMIIFIAVPLLGIGFFRWNGMPMERFVLAVAKSEFIYPRKRKFHTDNYFRAALVKKNKKRNRKEREASLERAYLMAEAEQNGIPPTEFDVDAIDLLTVRTQTKKGGKNPKRPPKKKREKSDADKKLQAAADEIKKKIEADPQYVPDKKESAILKKWNNAQLRNRKKEIEAGKRELRKKSAGTKHRRKARSVIPKTIQQSIPYIADLDDGVFEVAPNQYAKMYRLVDINYRTGQEDERVRVFCKLGEFYNYFSEDMHFQIVIDNRVISVAEQERKVFYPLTGDAFDRHRQEYNSNVLRRQIVSGRNDIQDEKYVTVTIDANTQMEAIYRFHKIDNEVISNLRKIGSDGYALSTTERLEYYHDKFRKGHEGEFLVDYDFLRTQGISSKDYIAPTFMQFDRKQLQIDDEHYRVLFLNNLPASLQDEFLHDLCDNDFPVVTSLSVQPVAQDKGLKLVRSRLTGIQGNKQEAEKSATRAGYDPNSIPHSIKDAYEQAESLLDDMVNKNQKLLFLTITVLVHGSTSEELEEHCKTIQSKARKYMCQLQVLSMQQEEGFKVTLPFGYPPKDIVVARTLTTESASIFMPFSCTELFQSGGFYYGLNKISRNLVIVNRTKMKSPSGFVLGSSGSGKSFAVKRELLNVLLQDHRTGAVIIDPDNEYSNFVRAFNGTILNMSTTGGLCMNPFDMPPDYGLDEDDNPDTPLRIKKDKALKKKSEYIITLAEQMVSTDGAAAVDATYLTPRQRTIIDRCVKRCYKDYLDHDFDAAYLPTMITFQGELDKEDDRELAEAIELYSKGSLNIFSGKTNVEIDNRLVVFNTRDLSPQLRNVAQTIMFDFIWNRTIQNKNVGVRTYLYADEIHTMFQNLNSANYLKQYYKRGRKYGLVVTGITQNVEDLLRSEQACGMIGNSDFVLMLNQKKADLTILADMLDISETLQTMVSGVDPGEGLIYAEKVIVPFVDHFPRESYLYDFMTTDFNEYMSQMEIEREIQNLIAAKQAEEMPDAG